MTGIFQPQILQGSSLRGESFVKQPVERISGQALDQLAGAGTQIYGAYQASKAAREIGAAQDQFLDDLSATRSDIAQIEQIREEQQAGPGERATFEDAQSQIKTLEDAINSRRINPAEAQARVESIKRKAISRAPFFADRIRGLTGSRGEIFDAETDQLIKESNKLRELANGMGLVADNPAHLSLAREILATNAEAEFLKSQGQIEGVKSTRLTSKMINQLIAVQENVIQETIRNAGGLENLDTQQSSELVGFLQSYQNGNEKNVVRNMIDANSNLDYGLLPESTITNLEAQVKGAAETLQKQISGEIPSGISENRLNLAQNTATLKLQRDNPGLFNMIIQMSKLPSGTLAGTAVNEVIAEGLLVYGESAGLNDLTGLGKTGLENKGVEEPSKVQASAAKNIANSRNFISNSPQSVDPEYAAGHFDVVNTHLQALSANPQDFNPAMFDEMLAHLASPELMKVVNQLDSVKHEELINNGRQMINQYTTENMAKDLARELDKKVSLTDSKGFNRRLPMRDVVSATVNSNGTLVFRPNTGLDSVEAEQQALEAARKLTKMYSGRSTAIVKAAKNIGGIQDSLTQELSVRLFQEALGSVGEPLRNSPDTVPTPAEPTLNTLTPRLSRDR